MADNLVITNYDVGGVVIGNPKYKEAELYFPGTDTYLIGTLLAMLMVAVGAVTADGGNTGDGTVTLFALAAGAIAKIGTYTLECTDIENGGTFAGAMAFTGTGNGTSSAVVPGDLAIIGDYIITCKTIAGTGAGSMAFTGTGNGTSSAVVAGALAINGDYIITCIDVTVSGSEIFEVIDPNGDDLENLTVGVAYLNEYFGVTLTDGSTDFVAGDYWTLTMTVGDSEIFGVVDPNGNILEDLTVGVAYLNEHFGVTVSDGSTNFIIGDYWTLAMTVTEGGTFKLTDPSGMIIKDDIQLPGTALGTVLVTVDGLTFTITDGATDFIVGDKFTLVVASASTWVIYAAGGIGGAGIAKAVLTVETAKTGSGNVSFRPLISGDVRAQKLIIDAVVTPGSGITDEIKEQLRDYGIIAVSVVEHSIQDNQ